ncbi:MAG: ABC transporter [Clostridia bacterium]|nr:ABC transporter [Clostridia bacterium]
MKAVYKREMRAYFTMPIGYIVLAVMMALMGMYYSYMCQSNYFNISFVFSSISSIVLFIAPVITMRLFSEDRKQKVDQALFTAPVKLINIIMGKFFAALTLFMLPMAITLIYQILLMFTAEINWLTYLCDLLGVALLGSAIIAIGMFISALTESQIIAGIFGLAVSFFIMQIDYFATAVGLEWFKSICTAVSFITRYNAFTAGQLDFSNCVFFISVTAMFIYFTYVSFDKKRWA